MNSDLPALFTITLQGSVGHGWEGVKSIFDTSSGRAQDKEEIMERLRALGYW
ncbi:MAG: hypothetical protein ACE5PM_04160 [Candidatus Hydrothermarchaeales archaeon]